ncbi:hypothetical protein D3C72_1131510 [compost metagenome]
MAAREGNHVFLLVDGEILHLFREIPQSDHVRFPRQNLLFHVEEHFGERLAGERAAPQPDKIVPAQNIQHRRAVIHRVAFGGDDLLLRLVAAHYKEQVAAILFVQLVPGGVFHCQMVGRDDNHRVFEIRRGFDFIDKCGDMFLATGHGAERLIGFAVDLVLFALAGARDKTVRVVCIDGEGKQRETLARFGQLLEFLPGFIQHRVVVEAPIVAIRRVGYGGF